MWHQLIAGLLALGLLTACRPTPLQEQQAYVFGTRVEVIVVGTDAEVGRKAIASVLREFDRLHQQFHAWQPSQLSTLNSALAGGRPQQVSDELRDLIRESQALSRQGNHLFDPGIGTLIRLWGFQADEFRAVLPEPNALTTWQNQRPSIADIELQGNRVSSRNRAVALDFGGYLKGVALDRAAEILRAQGIHHALINIGGNVMALGNKEGRKWRVGIQHPRAPGTLATIDLEDGEAIGTSGDYQRYFELGGQRYSHLLDPRTAKPADHTQAVAVVVPSGHRSGTRSDGLSKPIFIAGPLAWRDTASANGIEQVLRVDRSGRIQITSALYQRLKLIDAATEVEILP